MPSRLDRLLSLAKKTGHPLIIHDPAGSRDLVIMDVTEYEFLLDDGEPEGTEAFDETKGWDDAPANAPLDKIDSDIAFWKAAKEAEEAKAAPSSRSWNSVGEVLMKKGLAGIQPVPPAAVPEDISLQAAAEPLPDEPVFFEEPME